MSKYFIQTRHETQNKRIGDSLRDAFTGQEWNSRGGTFDSFEEAEERCIDLIEKGLYRAKNIRVCQVAGEFESTVTVKTKEQG